MVRTRATITRSMRESLHGMGFVEVETPVLQLVHGGANARPFNTHLNAFDIDMTLRIALELFLKRAVVGGVEQVYEIGRIFRNEGIDSTHSAEFTMLEVYQAWGDQRSIAEVIKTDHPRRRRPARFAGHRRPGRPDRPRRRMALAGCLSGAVRGDRRGDHPQPRLRSTCASWRTGTRSPLDPAWGAQKIVMELFGELVEPTLIQPTFVCDYPPIAQPLARPHRSDPNLIEAWDLIIGGVERGTGFSELIDPVIQRERLTAQSLAAAAGDPEAMQLDEDFLAALEFGAPPMGGLGLGIDRLVMLFTGAGIRETILFPLLRPED